MPVISPLGSQIGALTLVRTVGIGASATVYHARSESGVQYAVKVIRTKKSDLKRRKLVLKEILVHTLVASHPNIISLLDVLSYESPSGDSSPSKYTLLVLPLAFSGDLCTLIMERGLFLNKPVLSRSVFLQILSAVQHCHSMGIFHRDVKSENILAFDEGRRVMLADFGLATTNTRTHDWLVGTLCYMSPECIGGSYRPKLGYSSAANDIWSLGILLINILTGRHPWDKASASDKSFVQYCKSPNDYLIKLLPLSSQANAILRRIFVAEDYRPSIAMMVENMTSIKEWYSFNAVFEGSLARWRLPKDEIPHDRQIQYEERENSAEEPKTMPVHDYESQRIYIECASAITDFPLPIIRWPRSGSSLQQNIVLKGSYRSFPLLIQNTKCVAGTRF